MRLTMFAIPRTTWWMFGFLVAGVAAAMVGLGGLIPAFWVGAAFVASTLFLALFAVSLLIDGALHLTHTAHFH